MLTIGILGLASSLLTEAATWLNKKLSTTPLKGDGSFLVVAVISIAGGALKIFFIDHTAFQWSTLVDAASSIFAVSQVYFVFIASKLGLTVNPESTDLN